MFLLNNNKISVTFFYKSICKIYQYITTLYENYFLKLKPASEDFYYDGHFQFNLNKAIHFENKEKINLLEINNFLKVKVLKKNQLISLIDQVFTKDLRRKITEKTGFNFSIDFMIYYERHYIPENKRNVSTLNQAYSYRWHFDKPNSSNMLKIFIPVDIENRSGPLELINKSQSARIKSFKDINKSTKRIFLKGILNKIYGFYPTICCHRDGIPEKNTQANQIMFQLNPNKDWAINCRIFKNNLLIKNKIGIWTNEPKFPHISYLFDKRITLN